ncbi:MAG TPA: hypothetical protein VEH30_07850 [Terriglobales bacterium]|nr:hypothetical protein [Terriglobales bacterium]
MKFLTLFFLAMSLTALLACSKPHNSTRISDVATPEARLQQIPPADPEKYGHVRDMKTWHNPYLLVKQDGLWLLDVSNNEERPLPPDQVLSALAALPASAWPYGRVVAVQEISAGSSDADRVALRKNRAILAGTLEAAKVLINWVPNA